MNSSRGPRGDQPDPLGRSAAHHVQQDHQLRSQPRPQRSYPSSFAPSSTTNVTVRPFAAALGCPGVPSKPPIPPGAATVDACGDHHLANHHHPHQPGLVTGDRVVISNVTGNSAANGVFTVTALNANQFTLDGSTGNGTWTGGGSIQACQPSPAACSATPARTDFSRFRNVADTTDPVASAQVAPASRFAVIPGPTGQVRTSRWPPTARAPFVPRSSGLTLAAPHCRWTRSPPPA